MIFRSRCVLHAHDPAIVEIEFKDVPGPIIMRVYVIGGQRPELAFHIGGHAYFHRNNQIRCDSELGPVIGYLDLEKRAVRMRFFPYTQLCIPDKWHVLPEAL